MGGVEESWVMNLAASLSLRIEILMKSSLKGGVLMKVEICDTKKSKTRHEK